MNIPLLSTAATALIAFILVSGGILIGYLVFVKVKEPPGPEKTMVDLKIPDEIGKDFLAPGPAEPMIDTETPVSRPRFVMTADDTRVVMAIKKKRTTIGRLKDNDFIISDRNVSGHHSILIETNEGYFIEDCNSTNGLFVNNERVQRKQIVHNTVVKFGPAEYMFKINEDRLPSMALEESQAIMSGMIREEVLPSDLAKNIEQLGKTYSDLRQILMETKSLDRITLLDMVKGLADHIDKVNHDYKEVERAQEMVTTLFDTSHVISSILDKKILLSTLMDLVIKVMKAERGFIMLKDESGQLNPAIARKMAQEIMGKGKQMVSRSIAEKSFADKAPILTTDAQEDPRFMSGQSIIAYNIRSVMTVPLMTKDDCIGVIYIDNREKAGAFKKRDLHFLTMFAAQAAIAIENAQLYQSLETRINELSTIAEIIRTINSTLELDKVLNLILDMLMDLIGAVKGSIVLLDEKKQKYFVRALKGDFRELYMGAKVVLGNSLAGKVADTGQSIMVNKMESEAEEIEDTIYSALLMVPMKIKGKVIGVLNLTNKKNAGKFTNNDLSLVESLAYQAAQACENARLYANVKDEERMRTNLTRFLSPDIVNQIIQAGDGEMALGGEKKIVTMLFTDLRNFTSTCEKTDPALLITTLNEYFSAMTEIIFEYGGTLDKFMGDAIMVLFGAPFGHPDDALRAVCTGWTMLEKLSELHEFWKKDGKPSFGMGMGIHTGEVIAGNVGSVKRMEYTVIGRNVNRASRLESANKEMGTSYLISRDTLEMVKDQITFREAGAPYMKGIAEPEIVYEVTGIKPGVRERVLERVAAAKAKKRS